MSETERQKGPDLRDDSEMTEAGFGTRYVKRRSAFLIVFSAHALLITPLYPATLLDISVLRCCSLPLLETLVLFGPSPLHFLQLGGLKGSVQRVSRHPRE